MPGLYVLIATRTDGETLTAAKYNGDHQNHIDNQELQKTDDFSATAGQMQTTTDPGEVGTESLATDASGELARLRFAIKETKDALGTAVAQWYVTPATISGLIATQNTRNICVNADFEDWRDGTGVAPFGFVLSGVGASVARDGANFKTTKFAASVTRVTNDAILQRDCIAEAGGQAHIRSRAYRVSAWVRATVASRVRLRINDGVGSTFSSYHSGGGTFERLSVTRTLDSLATALNCGLSVDTGDTVGQIDTMMVTEGTAEVAFALRGETSVFRQVFTASGTYTKPSNLVAARVLALGGGGKGGNATFNAAVTRAGGGGAGSETESWLAASSIGATETITVGAAAADSSFSALVVGKGGSAAADVTDNPDGAGGAGGVAGTGDFTRFGGAGSNAGYIANQSGDGGASPRDAGISRGVTGNSNGNATPANSGRGGSGASRTGAGTSTGGAGGSGIVVVWETVVV